MDITAFLDTELERRYSEYVVPKNLNIFCGTWNVNAKDPNDEVKSWLEQNEKFKPDILALGFQEIVDLNAVNLLIDSDADKKWEDKIIETLPEGKYELLCSERLVGILLLVYVAKDKIPWIPKSEIVSSHVGVGLFGHAGNKGGVGIRFKIYDSEIVFICTHLAAHKNNVQGRNQDYANIIQNIKFNVLGEEIQANDHHFIFWIGDLNYRLNHSDLETVYKKIRNREIEDLLRYDQLKNEMNARNVFRDFHEGDIHFSPTYKFIPGKNEYDQRPDKKLRMPAWCDRVLWSKGDKTTCNLEDVKLLEYGMSTKQTMSDHKPVYALFEFEAHQIDGQRQHQTRKLVTKQYDYQQNQSLMKVSLPTEHKFNDVKFGEPKTIMFEVVNVGQVVAEFEFANRLEDQHDEEVSYSKKWLKIEPLRGRVAVGSKKTITLTAHIKRDSVEEVTKQGMEDFLIFRLARGGDAFITIFGNYCPSCFGQTIEKLVKIRQPISRVNLNDIPTPETALSLPKEVWRMIDYIYKFGLDTPQLFKQKGIASEVSEIRDCLDHGKEFQRVSIHSMAEALIRFLESLIDPVFPAKDCDGYQEQNLTQFCKEKLSLLPTSHYNTFIYVVSFLREVLRHESKNRCNAKTLAYQFGSTLLHAPIWNIPENELAEYPPFRVLYHFLTGNELGS